MSNITTYKNLIDRFTTSEALFAHLKSAEGGGLTVAVPEFTAANPLAVITYNKEKSNMAHPDVEYFRSVIWDMRKNRPVCVAPSRGRKFAELEAEEGAAVPEIFLVEDFVDGVMINMFYHAGAWRLTTRSRLDADGNFYGKRPFAELFWETFGNAGLKTEDFDTAHCYSWVMQHPEERVVVAPPYGIAKIVPVEACTIAEDGGVTVRSGADLVAALPARAKTLVLEEHKLTKVSDVKARVEAWGRRFGGQWQGLVVKADGKRWKLRSSQYDAARNLRGNQANRTYRWLELWGKKLEDYLRLFPEERADAEAAIAAFKVCTQELYDLYQKVYRRRELPLGKAPQKFRKLLWEAHQKNAGAYFANTRKFMNEQDTARKVWLVNYEKRYGASAGVVAETEDGAAAVGGAGAGASADDAEAVRAAVQALAEAVAARAAEFPPLPYVTMGTRPDGKLSCGCDSAKHDCVA
jgi:hypothetical protein